MIKGAEICDLNIPFLDKFLNLLEDKKKELSKEVENQDFNLSMLDKIERKILLLKEAYQTLARVLRFGEEFIESSPLTPAQKTDWRERYISIIGPKEMTTFPGPLEISPRFRDLIVFKRKCIESMIRQIHKDKTELEETINPGSSTGIQNKMLVDSKGLNFSYSSFEILNQLYLLNKEHLSFIPSYLATYLQEDETKYRIEAILERASNQNEKLKAQMERARTFFTSNDFLTEEQISKNVNDFLRTNTFLTPQHKKDIRILFSFDRFYTFEDRENEVEKFFRYKSFSKEQKEEIEKFFTRKFLTQVQKEKYVVEIRKEVILYTQLFRKKEDFLFKKPTEIKNSKALDKESIALLHQLEKIEKGIGLLCNRLDEISLKLEKTKETGLIKKDYDPELLEGY